MSETTQDEVPGAAPGAAVAGAGVQRSPPVLAPPAKPSAAYAPPEGNSATEDDEETEDEELAVDNAPVGPSTSRPPAAGTAALFAAAEAAAREDAPAARASPEAAYAAAQQATAAAQPPRPGAGLGGLLSAASRPALAAAPASAAAGPAAPPRPPGGGADTAGNGDEDISDTDDEHEELTEQQMTQLAALYGAGRPPSAASVGGAAGPPSTAAPPALKDESGTDTDEDGELIQKAKANLLKVKAAPPPKPRQRPSGGGGGRARGGGGVNIKLLLDEGLLAAGTGVLVVEYKGQVTKGDLSAEGKILYNGMTFESPSAFSIYLKRLVNPSRKADDGWKTVKYQGKFLEHYKLQLARQRFPNGPPTSSAAAGAAALVAAAGASHGRVKAGPGAHSAAASPPSPEHPAKKAKLMNPMALARSKKAAGPPPPAVPVVPAAPPGDPAALLSFASQHGNKLDSAQALALAQLQRQQAARAQAAAAGEQGDHDWAAPSNASNAAPAGPTANGEAGNGANRPRRMVRPSNYGNAATALGDEHQMVPCEGYSGPPGSGQRGAQPFRLEVSPVVEILMDFHAHLSTNEVIGVLGGYFDPQQRLIRVVQAFPVFEIPTDDNSINVEMDPEDEFRVREQITGLNMRCVGWYHSHPNFATLPSLIDIYNQSIQQAAHREGPVDEPYVAAIVGPYDRKLPGMRSSLLWFYVDHPPGQAPPPPGCNPLDAGCSPMELKVEAAPAADMEYMQLHQASFLELAQRYAQMPGRPDMESMWREGIPRLAKLAASIQQRLPGSWPRNIVQQYVQRLGQIVKNCWNAALGGAQR